MIKAIKTVDKVTYISRHDPGLDLAACKWGNYLKTFDERHIAIKPGEAVTRWVLRPCSQVDVRRALGTSAVEANGAPPITEVGARLLSLGLVGASDKEELGDKFDWPHGVSDDVMKEMNALVQMDLAEIIYMISNGHGVQGGLEDEGKLPSPSSSKEQGTSTKRASSATTAKKTKTSGDAEDAPSPQPSES